MSASPKGDHPRIRPLHLQAAFAKLASHKASLPRQLQRGNPVIATHRQDLHAPTLPRKRRKINQAPHPLPPRPPSDLLSLRYSNLSRCKTLQMKSRPQNPGSKRECQPSFFRWVRRDGYCQKNLPSIFFRPRPAHKPIPECHTARDQRNAEDTLSNFISAVFSSLRCQTAGFDA